MPRLCSLSHFSSESSAIQPLQLAYGILGFAVVALFTRIGNGVYNKAADIGADLVRSSEAAPDPAVIADSAGDVLGGVVGATSDLGDSFVMSVFGGLVLGGAHCRSGIGMVRARPPGHRRVRSPRRPARRLRDSLWS